MSSNGESRGSQQLRGGEEDGSGCKSKHIQLCGRHGRDFQGRKRVSRQAAEVCDTLFSAIASCTITYDALYNNYCMRNKYPVIDFCMRVADPLNELPGKLSEVFSGFISLAGGLCWRCPAE